MRPGTWWVKDAHHSSVIWWYDHRKHRIRASQGRALSGAQKCCWTMWLKPVAISNFWNLAQVLEISGWHLTLRDKNWPDYKLYFSLKLQYICSFMHLWLGTHVQPPEWTAIWHLCTGHGKSEGTKGRCLEEFTPSPLLISFLPLPLSLNSKRASAKREICKCCYLQWWTQKLIIFVGRMDCVLLGTLQHLSSPEESGHCHLLS